MKVLRYTDAEFGRSLEGLKRTAEPSAEVRLTVGEIIADVRKRGDAALLELTEKFGGPKLAAKELLVTGRPAVDAATRRAISVSHKNVHAFAKRSLRKNWTMRNAQGGLVGERFDPFERVGIYVPGGTAPLVSTSVMTVTLAKAAGCPEIVVTTPSGKSNTVVLFFPLAFTGVCTDEFCDISQGLNSYKELGAEVIGISVDSPFAQEAWAQSKNINVTLASDLNKKTAEAYGVLLGDLIGLGSVSARAAFVVDKNGVVQYAEQTPTPKELPNFEAIKAKLATLK